MGVFARGAQSGGPRRIGDGDERSAQPDAHGASAGMADRGAPYEELEGDREQLKDRLLCPMEVSCRWSSQLTTLVLRSTAQFAGLDAPSAPGSSFRQGRPALPKGLRARLAP